MPPAPQSGGQSDNSMGMLWGIAAVFATMGIVWYTLKKYIVSLYLLLKLYELSIVSVFSSSPQIDQLRAVIRAAMANPGIITFNDLLLIGSSVGSWIRIPLAAILIVCAFIVFSSNTTRVFKRTYSMKDLAKLEKDNWPQINPIIGLDLGNKDIDKGPWAMGLSPMQFCKRYRLIAEVQPRQGEGVSRQDRGRINVVLLKGPTNKLFSLQLGPLWQGPEKLPLHTKALFAAFAARINSDTKSAENLLRQLNVSSTGKLDYTGVDALLKKHVNTKLVKKITESHAYIFTVMAAMIAGAREDGVQASADFLWLKPKDRKLWYTLNTVGRQTPFSEVAGIFAHWLAEKEAGRKLLVPVIEEATKALELALKEIVYLRDEE